MGEAFEKQFMANLPDFGQFTQSDVDANPKSVEQRNDEYGIKNKSNTKIGGAGELGRPLIKPKSGKPNLFQQSHDVSSTKIGE